MISSMAGHRQQAAHVPQERGISFNYLAFDLYYIPPILYIVKIIDGVLGTVGGSTTGLVFFNPSPTVELLTFCITRILSPTFNRTASVRIITSVISESLIVSLIF